MANVTELITCLGTLIGGISTLIIAIIAYRKWGKKEQENKNSKYML